jgi:hypothetical protein
MTDDRNIGDDIMRMWRQGFDTWSMARFLYIPEFRIERLLHAELERRRRLREGVAL